MHKGLQWQPSTASSPYGTGVVSSCSQHKHPSTHLDSVYSSFSDLIWFNSGLHRFNLQMKNAVWHFIWLPRMCSGWPSFLMKHFKGPAALHYWHSPALETDLESVISSAALCRSGQNWCVENSPFNITPVGALVSSTALRRWRSQNRCLHPFSLFCEWSVYLRSICHLRHLIINSISRQSWRLNSDLWQMSSGY